MQPLGSHANKLLFFEELKGKREVECERMDGKMEKKHTEREREGKETKWKKKERAKQSKQRRD